MSGKGQTNQGYVRRWAMDHRRTDMAISGYINRKWAPVSELKPGTKAGPYNPRHKALERMLRLQGSATKAS